MSLRVRNVMYQEYERLKLDFERQIKHLQERLAQPNSAAAAAMDGGAADIWDVQTGQNIKTFSQAKDRIRFALPL